MSDVVESLLQSTRLRPPGDRWAFIVNRMGHPALGGIGHEVYVDRPLLRRSALLAMGKGHEALRGQSIGQTTQILQDFLECEFGIFSFRVLGNRTTETLLDLTDSAEIAALSTRLEDYLNRQIEPKAYLIPAWRIASESPTVTQDTVLVPGGDTPNKNLGTLLSGFPGLIGDVYPPVRADLENHAFTEKDTWLGVIAPSDVQGRSRLAQLCGALSLALEFPHSRQISMAEDPQGLTTASSDGRWSYTTNAPYVPPIASGASLNDDQIQWLMRVMLRGIGQSEIDRRIAISLEYVAAGWTSVGRLGFIHNAIAFDALFGKQRATIQGVTNGVSHHAAGISQVNDRIGCLLKMRHELLHGRQPSVEMTNGYRYYVEQFDVDPHNDQIMILRACFRSLVP